MKSKMYNTLIICALMVICTTSAQADYPAMENRKLLNLLKEHSMTTLIDAGLRINPISGLEGMLYSFGQENLKIMLPNEITFEMETDRGEVFLKMDQIRSITLISPEYNNETVLKNAVQLHEIFHLSAEDLSIWMEEAINGRERDFYTKANNALRPRLSVGIRKSFNKAKPWRMLVRITWD